MNLVSLLPQVADETEKEGMEQIKAKEELRTLTKEFRGLKIEMKNDEFEGVIRRLGPKTQHLQNILEKKDKIEHWRRKIDHGVKEHHLEQKHRAEVGSREIQLS